MHVRDYFDFLNDDKLRSIRDVEQALARLNSVLLRTNLEPLVNFNHTYLVITRNVRQAVVADKFEHPTFLHNFDTRFAHYYFVALRSYVESKPAAPAWQSAFDAARGNEVSPLIAMSLGVNAHVNNDIPQVLVDTKASGIHLADYNLVNDIIKDSIYEVIEASLRRHNGLVNPKNALLKPVFKKSMDIIVPRWRDKAWQHFQALQSGKTTVAEIEDYAMLMKGELTKLPV